VVGICSSQVEVLALNLLVGRMLRRRASLWLHCPLPPWLFILLLGLLSGVWISLFFLRPLVVPSLVCLLAICWFHPAPLAILPSVQLSLVGFFLSICSFVVSTLHVLDGSGSFADTLLFL
jgi:hypothetical protein